MANIAQTVVREPESDTPDQYAERVHRLAISYTALFLTSLIGIGLLIRKAQLFVALTQRSNVETLTLAFFLIFFGYIAVISAGGATGAVRIAFYALLARFGKNPAEVERRKSAALGRPQGTPPTAALNVILEQESRPGEPFELSVADGAGSMGRLAVNGAEVKHLEARRDGSNSLIAFFVHQVSHILGERGAEVELDVVHWKLIDDESTLQYLGIVQFARNLQRQLGTTELWPKVTLTDADCKELERRLSAVCPALRDEAFLPQWEYQAEHKLPLIPEPLGLVSLSRTERRVDPIASMGCAVLVVAVVVLVLGLFIVFPPWVPGS